MSTSYVRLRGLPFMTTDQELAQWFQTAPGGALQAVRVLFTFNTSGRKSGEAVREASSQSRHHNLLAAPFSLWFFPILPPPPVSPQPLTTHSTTAPQLTRIDSAVC